MRRRLDTQVVRLGLARSREQAQQLIAEGRVLVAGMAVTKAASQVDDAVAVRVLDADVPDYASRGAHKLLGALARFGDLQVAGRWALDAGASTGGFTDVLLRAGAAAVIAVDVGYGQLAWGLRSDDRVIIMDRTNVRSLVPGDLDFQPDLVVSDLSFISLKLVLPARTGVIAGSGDMLLMVKPQFEVGREALGTGGVVRDPRLRSGAVVSVANAAWDLGWGLQGVVASSLPGPAGNVEYFIWLRRDAAAPQIEIVEQAVREGPQ
jgi:23S rRNA (cytidine1920-2'-O)/16S rRNA (cytidine1409-2'-O)-methyltransferase